MGLMIAPASGEEYTRKTGAGILGMAWNRQARGARKAMQSQGKGGCTEFDPREKGLGTRLWGRRQGAAARRSTVEPWGCAAALAGGSTHPIGSAPARLAPKLSGGRKLHIPRSRRPIELALPALLFTAPAILLLASPAGGIAHPRPLLLEGLVLGLFAAALARLHPAALTARAGAVLRAGPNLALLLLVVYAFVSSRLAPARGLANSEWLRVAGGVILYFLVAYATQVQDRYRTVVDGLIAIALLGTVTELARSAQ